MKTIFLIIACLLLGLMARSQSFVNTQNTWNVKEGYYSSSVTHIYHYDGDSLHNDVLYKKMYAWHDSTFTSKGYVGMLREVESKVWYVPPYVDEEGLLYDFSLNVGDTIDVISMFCWEYYEYGLVCQTIDSIQLETGEYRKRWIFEGWSGDMWVEGVGSLFGPVHSRVYDCVADYYVELLCLYHDDILVYSNPSYSFCYINTLSIPEVESGSPVQISPNPVRSGNSIKITASFDINKVEICNSHGILIKRLAALEIRDNLIETRGLTSGLHIIKITGRNGEIVTEKLLIL